MKIDKGILAIDIGGTKVALAVLDRTGKWLTHKKIIIAGELGNRIVEKLIVESQKIVKSCQVDIIGIGISTIGVIKDNYLKLVPTISGWDQINLKEIFQKNFPEAKIILENDVKAATYAEILRGSLRATTSGIYLNLGTGIAIGLSLKDQVVKGSHGAAGEIGYFLTQITEDNSFSNGHAPLEEIIGGQAIGQHLEALTGSNYTAKELWNDSLRKSEVKEFKSEVLRYLTFTLSNLCIMWDPEVVVVGGGMEAAYAKFVPALEKALQKNVPFAPKLKPAFYKQNASLNGIGLLTLKETYGFQV
ncbi:ROK family protein [Liquorilactobacillus satsumensis]|uniref:ROK family protein n=1 Tax=Liquorilactobacillus TaxID=2767888 RepID=UPI0021C4AFF3|nr:ROK family protein [Liquorilactobacillus satsumensis]